MIKVKLTSEIVNKAEQGVLKAQELIQFVLGNMSNARTNKDISKVSLQDVSIDNKFIANAKIDLWDKSLILELS